MRKLTTALAFALIGLGATGCSFATTSVAGNSNVNGEAWYVRTTGIFSLIFNTKVFYCPPPTGNGPVTCRQAKMHDEGGATPMPSMHSGGDHAAPSDQDQGTDSDKSDKSNKSNKSNKGNDQVDQDDDSDD